MDTRQLEFFVAVADELSFTRAADRSAAAQSTVSAGVGALERELGVQLFERSTRSVALTPAGQTLLPAARTALAAVGSMHTAGAAVRAGLRGRVRVGLITYLHWLDMPALLGSFRRQHPLVDLSLATSPRGSSGLVQDVRRGRIDLAFIGLPAREIADLGAVLLRREPYAVLLPAEHRMAAADAVSLADLRDEPFVDLPTGFGTRTCIDQAAERQGVRRRIAIEIPDLAVVGDYVRAGLGVAVVPKQVADPGTVLRPLLPRLDWELFAATRPDRRTPAVDALLALIVAQAAAGG